ncbi:hypothetical protein AbaMCR54_17555 [Acinetobacter baumannii]|nr:hypothetical protein AbaMCR54_17555 [Acinetobacter baumannii]PPC55388.1 hypothetical protein AbaHEU2_01145 [Acinetobacter baumannii]
MYIFYTNNFETFRNNKKFSKRKIYFYIKKAKALYSSIIKSIFINILHKLKKEKYIVGTCFA